MALRDVFEEVKTIMEGLYPEGSTAAPSGFEHILGFRGELGRIGIWPRAIWIRPEPGKIVFDRTKVNNVGGQFPQLNTAVYEVEIHLWTENEEDLEEDRENGREAGVITQYYRALHKVFAGTSHTLVTGGWYPSNIEDAGFCFVLVARMEFQVNSKERKNKTFKTIGVKTGSVTP